MRNLQLRQKKRDLRLPVGFLSEGLMEDFMAGFADSVSFSEGSGSLFVNLIKYKKSKAIQNINCACEMNES